MNAIDPHETPPVTKRLNAFERCPLPSIRAYRAVLATALLLMFVSFVLENYRVHDVALGLFLIGIGLAGIAIIIRPI